MAVYTATNNSLTLTLTVTEAAVNQSANTSTVNWKLELTATNIYFTSRAIAWSVNIGGITKSETSTVTAAREQTITLGSGSGTIAHESNGSKTITVTAHAERSGTWSTAWTAMNISGSLDLTNIARYSQVSASPASLVPNGSNAFSISFPITSASYYYLLTVTMTNAAGTGTVELARWSGIHGTAGTDHVQSWTPAANVVNNFSDTQTQKTVQFNLVTYTNSAMTTSLGQTAVQKTLKASQSVHAPSLSGYTITETNALLTAVGVSDADVIGAISKKQIQVTASGNYGATVSSNGVTAQNGSEYTLLPQVSGSTYRATIEGNTKGVFTIRATDSRGFTQTMTQGTAANYIPYVSPTLSATVSRPSPTGSAVQCTLQGTCYSGDIGSHQAALSVTYKYKEKGASAWTDSANTLTPTISGTAPNGTYNSTFTLAESFLYNKQYSIMFTVSDGFTSATSPELIIFEGIPVFSWGSDHFDVYGEFHIHDRSDPENVYSVMTAGQKAIKVAKYDIDTDTLSGNSDNTVQLTLPTGTILAIIPHGCTPKVGGSWDTVGNLGLVNVANGTVAVHTIGSTSQKYVLRYVVIYQ